MFSFILLTGLSFATPTQNESPFWRPVIMGTHGMVAAEHPLEAIAGMKILEEGGNAIDAAVAVFYMTSVVEQHQAGIGGDGFILAYLKKENRVVFINGTGPAPGLATLSFYQKLGEIPSHGPLSTDVPGAVGGFDLALSRYGTKSYDELLAPAIKAAKGHPLDYWTASQHERNIEKISHYPSSVALLLRNGLPLQVGEVFKQPDLATSLEVIAKEGASTFYQGKLAKQTTAFYKSQNGLLSYEDLANFKAEESEPIVTSYSGLDVYQSAPNSQGIVMLIALNILEGFDLKALGHNSTEYIHVVTEALKLAFADRNTYVSDPRFVNIPVDGLLSKEYASERRRLIRNDRAIENTPPGDPTSIRGVLDGHTLNYAQGSPEIQYPVAIENLDGETSSFSIADQFGNLVSVTHSVNAGFGSGMAIPEGGYFLNNRMPYFSLNEKDVNALIPGKRTRHTVNPAIALKDGEPYLAWNTPGGDNQPQAMLQAFLAHVHFGMNVQQAVEAATVTSSAFNASNYPGRNRGMLTIPSAIPKQIADELSLKGHRIEIATLQQPYRQTSSGAGAVKMIRINPKTGVLEAGVSPAKSDYVLGW